jgi:hypothetical protein
VKIGLLQFKVIAFVSVDWCSFDCVAYRSPASGTTSTRNIKIKTRLLQSEVIALALWIGAALIWVRHCI